MWHVERNFFSESDALHFSQLGNWFFKCFSGSGLEFAIKLDDFEEFTTFVFWWFWEIVHILALSLLRERWRLRWLSRLHNYFTVLKLFVLQKLILLWRFFKKSTNFYYNYQNHLENGLHFLLFRVFKVLLLRNVPELLLCFDFALWKDLKKWFVYFFHRSFFLTMLCFLTTPLNLQITKFAFCTQSKTSPLFPLNRYLNSV